MKWTMLLGTLALSASVSCPSFAAGGFSVFSARDKLDWSGEIETYSSSSRDIAPQSSSNQDAVIYARLKPELKLKDGAYSLRTNLLFRADAGNSIRNTVRPDEAYLSVKIPDTSVTAHVGKILYSWGNDLYYNPADFLNPTDFYDFFHPDKLGVFAIDGNLPLSESTSLDVGVIPVFQPSVVSDPTSRWINYSNFISTAVVSKLSLPASLPSNFTIPFNLQQRNPKYPQFFARLSYRSLGFDASVSYSYRYNPVPQIVLFSSNVGFDVVNSLPTGTVQGTPYYQHEHFFTVDASKPALGSVFFLQSTISIPDVTQNDIPSSNAILSNINNIGLGAGISASDVNRSRSSEPLILTGGVRRDWSRYHVFLQYARIWYLRGTPPAALIQKITNGSQVNPTDVFDFFSGSLLPSFTWDFARKVSARVGAVVNLKSTGVVAEGQVSYAFVDGFKATLSYDYLDGKNGSLLASYSGNSRISLNLDMLF